MSDPLRVYGHHSSVVDNVRYKSHELHNKLRPKRDKMYIHNLYNPYIYNWGMFIEQVANL